MPRPAAVATPVTAGATPIVTDAQFAVSAPPEPDIVKMACPHHVNALTRHGGGFVANLDREGRFGPARRRGASLANLATNPDRKAIAASLQDARRQMRHCRRPEPELRLLIAELQAKLFPIDPIFRSAASPGQTTTTSMPGD